MITNFDFTTEMLRTLTMRVKTELNPIITAISTEDIPLASIKEHNIYTGWFDPVTHSNTPSVFIVPEPWKPDFGLLNTTNSYGAIQEVDLYIVIKQATPDPILASYQLYNYVKALVVLLNDHISEENGNFISEYRIREEGIELAYTVGSDLSKRVARIPISIAGEVFH
jgi:hypothetical protein